jgi:hypothetical protein
LATLNWTIVDSEGSLFSRGKHDYYAIVVHGIPKDRPKDCIIELYVADKEMTLSDIKYNARYERIKLLSRQIVLGNLSTATDIYKTIEEMKKTAEKEENANPYSSISSAYSLK